VCAGEGKQSGDRSTPLGTYTSVMADEDTVLEEAMDNLNEAGQRIRATQSLLRSQGMTDESDYRELTYVCVLLWRWSKRPIWSKTEQMSERCASDAGRGYEATLRVAKSV
jgi:hypothetical protein